MKILGLHGHFRLPDDFAGTQADALLLLCEFLLDPTPPMGVGPVALADIGPCHATLWPHFLDRLELGKRTLIHAAVYDAEDWPRASTQTTEATT